MVNYALVFVLLFLEVLGINEVGDFFFVQLLGFRLDQQNSNPVLVNLIVVHLKQSEREHPLLQERVLGFQLAFFSCFGPSVVGIDVLGLFEDRTFRNRIRRNLLDGPRTAVVSALALPPIHAIERIIRQMPNMHTFLRPIVSVVLVFLRILLLLFCVKLVVVLKHVRIDHANVEVGVGLPL